MLGEGATTPVPSSSRLGTPLHCTEQPVLLLHGFLATPLALSSLVARLHRAGHCAHIVQLGGLLGRFNSLPIEQVARVVADRVEQLAQAHRRERIDVVAHSAGGLIGRYYVQRLDGARRVRHLVTLGTPHRGTFWAYAGYVLGGLVPSLPQMAPGSPLLRALTDESFPRNVRLTSVYSPSDSICPPSSCRLESQRRAHLKNVEVARIGHLEFLVSARISSMISHELESVAPPHVASSVRRRRAASSADDGNAAVSHALGRPRGVNPRMHARARGGNRISSDHTLRSIDARDAGEATVTERHAIVRFAVDKPLSDRRRWQMSMAASGRLARGTS
jgi:pimeloyl-ACP methyl ester carboxylesterase